MKGFLKSSTAMAAVFAVACPVVAQEADEDDIEFAIEEITVTAQKRESTLLETPVAISAIGGSEIERAQTRDMRDIQTLVPTLSVSQFSSASNTSFSIRGIGSSTFNFGIEPAVGVFVDGVYRSRNGASVSDFLGLERIEVLRGPQSTLFGKNTTAGVINFVTKAPDYEWGVEGEITYGEYDALIAKLGVEGPILADKMAFRVDAYQNTRDGFVRDVVQDRDVNERDRWGFRAQTLFEPTDSISVRTIFDYNDINENCCAAPFTLISEVAEPVFDALGLVRFDPVDPWSGETAVDGNVLAQIKTWGLSSELNWEFDTFVFTALSAWRSYDEKQDIDADFTSGELNRRRVINQRYDTFTQEVRFTSTTDGEIDWLFGGYYFNQELFANTRTIQGDLLRPFADLLFGFPEVAALDPFLGIQTNGSFVSLVEGLNGVAPGSYLGPGTGLVRSAFDQNNEMYALFGQVDWHVTDRLTITGGIRYTNDARDVQSDIVIDDAFSELNVIAEFAEDYPIISQAATTATIVDLGLQAGLPLELALNPAVNPAFAQFSLIQQGVDAALQPIFLQGYAALSAIQFFPPANNFAADREDDDIQGNIIINYDASDTVNVYASYSSGFKAGGFALDASAARVGDFTFDPETADSYEIGVKSRLFDNRLAMNFALFKQKVKDFQANVFTGTSFVPDNAGSINIAGLEFDGTWAPVDGLILTGAFAWLFEREYGEFPNGPCPAIIPEGVTCVATLPDGAVVPVNVQDLGGQEISGTNAFRGSMTGTYSWNIGDDWQAFVRGEYAYQTRTYLTTELDPRQIQGGFGLAAASVGFGPQDGTWELQVWSRNLFDEQYLQGSFNSTVPGGNLNGYPGDPQTFGATLRFQF